MTKLAPANSLSLGLGPAEVANQVLLALSSANRMYAVGGMVGPASRRLLETLARLTHSQTTVLGQGQPGSELARVEFRASFETDAASSTANDNDSAKNLGYVGLDTLLARALGSDEPLLLNRSSESPRSGRRQGRTVSSLACIPLEVGQERVGLVALLNRAGGYTESLLEPLQPLLDGLAQLLYADQLAHQRAALTERLTAGEEHSRLALEASGDGVFDWNITRGEVYLSPGWKALLGYRDDELPSAVTSWRERIHPDDLAAATQLLEAHFAGHSDRFECEYRIRHRDGSWRWSRACARVVAWSIDDKPVRFAGTQTDVTDRRAAERALLDSKDVAITAARARSEFWTVVSHELRTSLNAINGMATLLGDTSLDVQQRDFVGTLKVNSDALLGTVSDILDLSTLDSGQVRPELRAYDPRAIATEVLYNMRGGALEKGLALQYSGPPEAVWVLGDRRGVRKVLAHLVSNAIKFTDAGSVSVAASFEPNRICFRVEDTGIGIPEEQVGRVFEPFARVDPSFTRRHGGSGLGLAICKHLVDAMSGTITLESVEGRGSVFEVSLPATPTEATTPVIQSLRDPNERMDARLRERQPCVLVAEDNPVNQKVARAFLEKLGARVDCVDNGLEAVRAVELFPYDLVLMDCQMPVMDGYTATEHIRALPGAPRDIPIVALTANALESARERSLAAGMNGFLTKPLQRQALAWELYTHLFAKRDDEPTRNSLPVTG